VKETDKQNTGEESEVRKTEEKGREGRRAKKEDRRWGRKGRREIQMGRQTG